MPWIRSSVPSRKCNIPVRFCVAVFISTFLVLFFRLCHSVRHVFPNGLCLSSVEPYQGNSEVTQLLLTVNTGPGFLCRMTIRFYFADGNVILNQGGKNVSLAPRDLKFSFEVTGCTTLQAVLALPSTPVDWNTTWISPIGRTGGPVLELSGVSANPLTIIEEITGVDFNDSVPTTGKNWPTLCNSTFTGTGPLIPVPSNFNFSEETTVKVRGDEGPDKQFSIAMRFLKWAFADNSIYNTPSLPFTLDGLLAPQPIGNGFARWSIRVSVRTEFHSSVIYDPAFSLSSAFDLGAGEAPKIQTPAEIELAAGINTGAIIGGTVGAVAAVAIVGSLFFIPRFRRKVLPYSSTRARTRDSVLDQNPLPDDLESKQDGNSAAPVGQSPQAGDRRGTWSSGTSRQTSLTNV